MQTRRKKLVRDRNDESDSAIRATSGDASPPDTSQTVQARSDDEQVEESGGVSSPRYELTHRPSPSPQPSDRRPVQRLASVLPRDGSLSTTTGVGTGSTRPSSLKFKPKAAIRRSKEEREAFERAEAKRAATRAPVGGPQSRRNDGPGRGPFLSRGGSQMAGRAGNEGYGGRNASGVMGTGTKAVDAAKASKTRGAKNASDEESPEKPSGSKGKTRVKKETSDKSDEKDADVAMKGAKTSKRKRPDKVKKEDEILPNTSGDEGPESGGITQINVEEINLLSSEEESSEAESHQEGTGARMMRDSSPKARNWMMRPIFIQRHEHAERAVRLNLDASSYTSAELRKRAKARQQAGESLFLSDNEDEDVAFLSHKTKSGRKPKDVEFVRDERKWKGVWAEDKESTDVRIKEEPQDETSLPLDADEMDLDLPDHTAEVIPAKTPSSRKPKTKESARSDRMEIDEPQASEEELPIEWEFYPLFDDYAMTSLKYRLFLNDENDTFSDLDDMSDSLDPELEEMRELQAQFHAELDAEQAAEQAAEMPSSPRTKSTRESKQTQKQTHASDSRRAYLLQLPPVMPRLREADAPDVNIKPEPDGPTDEPAPSTTNMKKSPFKSAKDVSHNLEEKAEIRRTATYTQGSAAEMVGGQAGTLTFHANGKGIATWGGHSFEVNEEPQPSGQAREVFIMDREIVYKKGKDTEKMEEHIELGGKEKRGVAVGKVDTNLIATPDWSTLLE